MARNIINIGTEGNDGTGDSIRESFRKSNENFDELYSIFGLGGKISITNLNDTPSSYGAEDANKVMALNTLGTAFNFKTLIPGDGVNIISTDAGIEIINTSASLDKDLSPALSYHLNAQNQMIGYIRDPDPVAINDFNTTYGTTLNVDGRNFAISKGFADAQYVNVSGGTMTGPLFLNDHPAPLAGSGTPNGVDDLQATSKLYVDTGLERVASDAAIALTNLEETTKLYIDNGLETVASDAAIALTTSEETTKLYIDEGLERVASDATVALTNLEELKFTEGQAISLFSNDETFINNAPTSVPTEAAVQGYIDRRLGLDRNNTLISSVIGAGFLDRAGILSATGDLNLGNYKITNLESPVLGSDAANKEFVESMQLSDLRVDTTARTTNDLLVYNGSKWVNAESNSSGDISVSLTNNSVSLNIKSNTIVDADINLSAGILQSKLSLNAATTKSTSTGILPSELGVASFNSDEFTATDGWIEIKPSTNSTTGVTLSKIQHIGGNSIIGRRDGVPGAPTELTPGQVVSDGDGIKNSSFTTVGAMTVTGTSPQQYNVTSITSTGAANSLTKTGAAGELDIQQLKIDGRVAVDSITNTSLQLYTPDGVVFLSSQGTSTNNTITQITGAITATKDISTLTTLQGASGVFTTGVTTPLLTTGAASTEGTVIGTWSLGPGSSFQSTAADLAEYYEGDQNYKPGTVVVFGGSYEVTLTSIFGDTRVAGVVSTEPAYVMNHNCPGNKVCVALQGRVPVNVLGKVNKGDLLVTSARPGYAIVNNDPKVGTVIGKALQTKVSSNEGVIEVAVGRL